MADREFILRTSVRSACPGGAFACRSGRQTHGDLQHSSAYLLGPNLIVYLGNPSIMYEHMTHVHHMLLFSLLAGAVLALPTLHKHESH